MAVCHLGTPEDNLEGDNLVEGSLAGEGTLAAGEDSPVAEEDSLVEDSLAAGEDNLVAEEDSLVVEDSLVAGEGNLAADQDNLEPVADGRRYLHRCSSLASDIGKAQDESGPACMLV